MDVNCLLPVSRNHESKRHYHRGSLFFMHRYISSHCHKGGILLLVEMLAGLSGYRRDCFGSQYPKRQCDPVIGIRSIWLQLPVEYL